MQDLNVHCPVYWPRPKSECDINIQLSFFQMQNAAGGRISCPYPDCQERFASGITEREKVVSRKKQVKISPPTFKYNKISDHFKPKPIGPNEPKDEDKRRPGS